jgi:hypothetical protein
VIGAPIEDRSAAKPARSSSGLPISRPCTASSMHCSAPGSATAAGRFRSALAAEAKTCCQSQECSAG